MKETHVYLVPGFMGFTSLGTLSYFQGVSETLAESLAARGVTARVIECQTAPTGSIRRRADRLLQTVLDAGGLDAEAIHFVGHSTGGLDARLLLTHGVQLREDDTEARVAERTRSVVAVSTPHRGTPLANFFLTAQGQRLLEIVTVLVTTPAARRSVYVLARALSLAASLDDWAGRAHTLLDALSARLLREVTLAPDDPIWAYLHEMSSDQGIILQLTPESMDLFDAAVPDRDGIRYGSVVTAAPAPPAGIRPGMLLQPEQLLLALLFVALHSLATHARRQYPMPRPPEAAMNALAAILPHVPDARDSDGIVPVFSQVRGELVDVVEADHLDIVGQFPCEGRERLCDWLPSGAHFDRTAFEAAWSRIAGFIAGA